MDPLPPSEESSGATLHSGYTRYRIIVKPAPPLFKEPARFEPKVKKSRLAKMLIAEFFDYALRGPTKASSSGGPEGTSAGTFRERMEALLDRPCIYGTFGSRVGGFHPIKEKCTACMRCKQEYPDVIEDVVVTSDFAALNGFGMKPEEVMTVWYEAREGKELVKGMGYKGSFAGPGWDSIWLDMSEIVRPTRDGKMGREYISTSVDIGRRPMFYSEDSLTSVKTVTVQLPILFDFGDASWLNASVVGSTIRAAQRCGTMAVLPIGTYSGLRDDEKSCAIPLASPSEGPSSGAMGPPPAVEIENPLEFDLTKVQDSSEVVIARVPASGRAEESVLELTRRGFHAIHLVFSPDGRDVSGGGIHAKDLIKSVHARLVKECVRDNVSILVSGGITMAEHVPKAILCGCDAVALDTAVHVALQSNFDIRGGRYLIKPNRFDEEWGAQRLANLLAAWHEEFIEALSAMGKRDGRRLRGDVGRGIFYEELQKEAFGDIEVG